MKKSGSLSGREKNKAVGQWIYGKQVARQILKGDKKVYKVCLSAHDPEIESLAAQKHIPVQFMGRRELADLTGSEHHNGIAVETDPYQTYSLDEIVNHKHGEYGMIILLDEMEDPHNLGAVLRTADAVQADGVIFKKTHSVSLTPTVAKVSAGAIDTVKCVQAVNLVRTAQQLKEKGYWIIGADMDGQDYRSLKYDFNAVLVIGNEGKGISRLLKQECDYIVSLPMHGSVQSLNASVSAGILMYQITGSRFPL